MNSKSTIYDLQLKKTVFKFYIVHFAFCIFIYSCCSDKTKQVTYSENIAPLIYKHCTTCHRAGSAGTFNLVTYEDVRKHARQIELVTRTRVMPPWPADFNYSHFAGENYLSEEEIK